MPDLTKLESRLNIVFAKKDLLRQALTHRSYLNENPNLGFGHNERLEFLGDAVLELAVTEYLYRNYPDQPEGDMTNWRAALVNATMLAQIAADLDLGDYILLSRGETGEVSGRARQSIAADALEAVIGAIYLDQGYEAGRDFVEREILRKLPEIIDKQLYKNAKSRFQEEAQERLGITPEYKALAEWGPDHVKTFRVGVYLGEEKIAEGEGASKQDAEQQAADRGLKEKGW